MINDKVLNGIRVKEKYYEFNYKNTNLYSQR